MGLPCLMIPSNRCRRPLECSARIQPQIADHLAAARQSARLCPASANTPSLIGPTPGCVSNSLAIASRSASCCAATSSLATRRFSSSVNSSVNPRAAASSSVTAASLPAVTRPAALHSLRFCCTPMIQRLLQLESYTCRRIGHTRVSSTHCRTHRPVRVRLADANLQQHCIATTRPVHPSFACARFSLRRDRIFPLREFHVRDDQ